MKQIFDNSCYDILPAENGFIAILLQEDDEGRKYFCYKYVSAINPDISRPLTKQTFLSAKFHDSYDTLAMQIENHIRTMVVWPTSNTVFAVSSGTGNAKMLKNDGSLIWQGGIMYKDEAPSSIAMYNDTLWCSFPSSNALIRFNLRTMREELRIGGPTDAAFNKPNGIWIDEIDDTMYVCSSGSGKVTGVNLKTFTVNEHLSFEEPVKKYFRIGPSEIVMLDSGVYVL